mmetsp:Transcript_15989/g.48516  ORF Transcript_15989/g.48516 Transcript_15989/m.48516 type:complete len:226 (-) Transcript_15989:147-824(-)
MLRHYRCGACLPALLKFRIFGLISSTSIIYVHHREDEGCHSVEERGQCVLRSVTESATYTAKATHSAHHFPPWRYPRPRLHLPARQQRLLFQPLPSPSRPPLLLVLVKRQDCLFDSEHAYARQTSCGLPSSVASLHYCSPRHPHCSDGCTAARVHSLKSLQDRGCQRPGGTHDNRPRPAPLREERWRVAAVRVSPPCLDYLHDGTVSLARQSSSLGWRLRTPRWS